MFLLLLIAMYLTETPNPSIIHSEALVLPHGYDRSLINAFSAVRHLD